MAWTLACLLFFVVITMLTGCAYPEKMQDNETDLHDKSIELYCFIASCEVDITRTVKD